MLNQFDLLCSKGFIGELPLSRSRGFIAMYLFDELGLSITPLCLGTQVSGGGMRGELMNRVEDAPRRCKRSAVPGRQKKPRNQDRAEAHLSCSDANNLLVALLFGRGEGLRQHLGIPPVLMERLKKLPFDSLNVESRRFMLQVDKDALQEWLIRAENNKRRDHIVTRAVQLGARYDLVRRYCGVSQRNYRIVRESLGILAPGRGRIRSLSAAEETQMYSSWKWARQSQKRPLEALCRVAESTGISLDRIWVAFGKQLPDD